MVEEKRSVPTDQNINKKVVTQAASMTFASSDFPTKRFMGVQSIKTNTDDQPADAKLKRLREKLKEMQ